MLARWKNYVEDYVADLLVNTPTLENHVRTLSELFRRLQQGKPHRETKKVRAWSKCDRLPWSPAWGGNNRPSGPKCGESSGCNKS
ncbi:hypothetical protein PoB_000473600 [Plakobranchus ocellatus]|uniref:Uncharacterized protein n=1 Tax=Plakobranchus ocellatus TaxID=259542 RepID=A0AAV3XSC6_9GAST|nr:hypothetical protein PoB_000473600 [Plakobranchus ocellatus]